eukprot:CAMPEP_0179612476 /NCGR_PEP_ID=MMETSP0930-20121108/4546_1 /TAXON_ID=548131 ORGANISM="Ostreococcus mediterraneus, Strain clade-D-RCC1621" /NCGR_SAMPLE_ID=MMETSP0930 /ASSEMBLY_ACC=CAM_ASM_000580 /LENGTH=307 /DNA_ID=CAMNT_0021481117 /DNA_START=357 /DNA_END=1279 /DNA_ORIENTATION=-
MSPVDVSASVCEEPAAMSLITNVRNPLFTTRAGSDLFLANASECTYCSAPGVHPRPSCPSLSLPQVYTYPSLLNAAACFVPTAILTTFVKSPMRAGVLDWTLSSPQNRRLQSESAADVVAPAPYVTRGMLDAENHLFRGSNESKLFHFFKVRIRLWYRGGIRVPERELRNAIISPPNTTALEPTTLGNCPFAAASAALSGNVGFDHQSTASTVLTPVRVVHFAEHARRKRDTAESYTLIVIVSVLSALHSPFESRKMYVTTVEYDVSVGESTHGAAYDIVVCPASTRAVTSGLHASVVADGNSVSKA